MNKGYSKELNERWHAEKEGLITTVYNESGGLVAKFEIREEAEHAVALHNEYIDQRATP